MEYLTLLNYLYTISFNYRKRMLEEFHLRTIRHKNETVRSLHLQTAMNKIQDSVITNKKQSDTDENQKVLQEGAFFLHHHLTLLDKLFTLKYHKSAH